MYIILYNDIIIICKSYFINIFFVHYCYNHGYKNYFLLLLFHVFTSVRFRSNTAYYSTIGLIFAKTYKNTKIENILQ